MQIADAIWAATALLHQERPDVEDFEVQEIVSRAVRENFVGGFRPGLQPHASWHCVANKKPNGGRYRMLFETSRGRRRLMRAGDGTHPDRNGKIRPKKEDLPAGLQPLADWYDKIYSKEKRSSAAGAIMPHRFPPGTNTPNPALSGFDEIQGQTVFVGPRGAITLPDFVQRELNVGEGSCLSIYRDKDRIILLPISEDFVHKLSGSLSGEFSLLDDREREHRIEKQR